MWFHHKGTYFEDVTLAAAACNFFLLPQMEYGIEGTNFEDVAWVQKARLKVFKDLSLEKFYRMLSRIEPAVVVIFKVGGGVLWKGVLILVYKINKDNNNYVL